MRYSFAWLMVGWLFSASSATAQDAQEVLKQLRDAQQRSYQGSFIYERKDVFSTHRMWRYVDKEGQQQERFLQLNGPRLEMLKVDRQVKCVVHPNLDEPFLTQDWPGQNLNWQDLSRWYSMQLLGHTRVADRATLAVLFAPLDAHRYPLEVHMDAQTGVPLKSLLLNEHGQLLERFQFVEYSVDEPDAQDLLIEQPCLEPLPLDADEAEKLAWHWQLGWLPEGYQAVHQASQNWKINHKQVSNQSYSDGLAQFSVFVEPLLEQDVAAARLQLGPTAVVTRRLDTERGPYMITVLGEVPAGTAERLALSVRIQQQD
ncbi:MucB/RseB C-terminal domain-containing protein [Thiopseudomonas acetoxidans]|uniref:MucB/RseB C-terminal domain-containing protein n=1 Tax=Thiopseudomonas acetoxidans TaxID=3041622 RepID=A0ABT7SLV4_9GAMM|nr:MucB/RseB C-terminal domain-containing protein [Thiopseudomonas sp. CY1220]MDM7857169.1 MucB/RseB C-terminal domain-containing protein [Thiopseudomonas sp. CY1220]